MDKLKISQVAKAANVNVETVKYYVKRGLLSKPERNRAGYRLFSKSVIDDILLIKKAQEIGFTLNEIKHLLALIKQDDYFPTDAMYTFAMDKIKDINDTISRLEQFRSLLELAASQASQPFPRSKRDCPVLNKIRKG
ncbi:MerR family transcriptional regulator [Ornithinibacillus massiliensis]|uniref:MerR family transcriptional regulator n=1 Tax=Ornithinibacillus massiliensis TaxID=1944633 RepID=A0ABS5MA17_9BACI|nr:MerR family transcriptional regulator [Ornithinibacillus massiliensis]